MAASPSPYNHLLTIDVCFVCCSKTPCLKEVTGLQNRLTNYRCEIVCPKSSKNLRKIINESICIVLFTCPHSGKAQRNLVRKLNDAQIQRERIIAVGSCNSRRHFRQYQSCKLSLSHHVDVCIHEISKKVDRFKNIDNVRVQNDYEEIGTVRNYVGTVSDAASKTYIQHDQETDLKQVRHSVNPTDIVKDGKKSQTDYTADFNGESYISLRDVFIHAQTLEPHEGSHGAYTLESICKSQIQFGLDPDIMAQRFNSSEETGQIELRRFILTTLISNLNRREDFHGLSALLKCEDYRIQAPVIERLNRLQFETNYRKENADNFFLGLKVCMDLFERRAADHKFITNLMPIIVSTLAILYFKSLLCDGTPAIQDKLINITTTYKERILETSLGHQTDVSHDLLMSLEKILITLDDKIGKRSNLQMGNWNQALEVEENRENLKENIKKMSYIEQYACIMGTVNQLFKNDTASNSSIQILLKNLVQILFDCSTSKKAKLHTTLYPILLLVTKGLCRLLQDNCFQEGSQKIFEILDIYLDNPKFCLRRRTRLLEEMENLLCHSDKFVVRKVIYLLVRNGKQPYDIRKKVKSRIEMLLQSINMLIVRARHEPSTDLKPEWCVFDAKVCGSSQVTIHVLLPSLDCLAKGSMEDYKLKANEEETKSKITTLETLRHLQHTGLHPNVVKLIAYQVRPLPLFYIVERFEEISLYSYLHKRRDDRKWLSPTELVPLVADSVNAISYLHTQNVIHRDITTHSFTIVEKNNERKVVLTDMKLARILDDSSRSESTYASDLSYNQIPIRWSAPESILDDRYDRKTDTWMTGHLIQEAFTHGCYPYTELYKMDIDKILTLVVFHDLLPRQWPCIPKQIHEIVLQCVRSNPEDRIDLKHVLEMLNDFLLTSCDSRNTYKMARPFEEDKLHPVLDQDLNQPERGLPALFIDLKQSNENPRKSYFNLRKSKRKVKNQMELNEGILRPYDQPKIRMGGLFFTVKELVSKSFVENVLTKITEDVRKSLHVDGPIERTQGNRGGNDEIAYSLNYRCYKGLDADCVFDLASKNTFGDPGVPENENKYLLVVFGMVDYVQKLHKHNFIHRDIQCKHLYHENHQVFSLRLSRMIYLSKMSMDDSILEQVFDDNRHRMPVEVLHGGQYSKESDVYMLAMAMYEFYTALGLRKNNPNASDLECEPFCKIQQDQLLEHLYAGERPLQPMQCPDWLYDIMINCWDRDRTRRPSTEYILKQIQLKSGMTSNNNDSDIQSDFSQGNNTTSCSSDGYPKYEADTDTVASFLSNSSEDSGDSSKPPKILPRELVIKGSNLNFYRPKSTIDISPSGEPYLPETGKKRVTFNPLFIVEESEENISQGSLCASNDNNKPRENGSNATDIADHIGRLSKDQRSIPFGQKENVSKIQCANSSSSNSECNSPIACWNVRLVNDSTLKGKNKFDIGCVNSHQVSSRASRYDNNPDISSSNFTFVNHNSSIDIKKPAACSTIRCVNDTTSSSENDSDICGLNGCRANNSPPNIDNNSKTLISNIHCVNSSTTSSDNVSGEGCSNVPCGNSDSPSSNNNTDTCKKSHNSNEDDYIHPI